MTKNWDQEEINIENMTYEDMFDWAKTRMIKMREDDSSPVNVNNLDSWDWMAEIEYRMKFLHSSSPPVYDSEKYLSLLTKIEEL